MDAYNTNHAAPALRAQGEMKSRRVENPRGFTEAYAVSQPIRCKTKLTLGWHGQTPRNRAIECPMDAARGVCPCRRNRGKARASVAPDAFFIRNPFNATLVHATQLKPASSILHPSHDSIENLRKKHASECYR